RALFRAGQFDGEARACDLAVFHPVFGSDGAAMRLDDLARNGETEPGMLAKTVGTVRVEAVEDAFEIFGLNAGTFIFHADHDAARLARGDGAHRAGFGAEGKRVVDQVAHDLAEPRIEPLHDHAVAAGRAGVDLQLHARRARDAGFVEEIAHGFEKRGDIHFLAVRSRQLGIETRGV